MRGAAVLNVIRAYDDWIVRGYCWGRFWILRQRFLDEIEAGVLYVNRRAGATTGAWPGVQAFGGWKGSGSTGKSGLSMYYVGQMLREQSHTIVD